MVGGAATKPTQVHREGAVEVITDERIRREANAIRSKCMEMCPQYADTLKRIVFQVSHRMTNHAGYARYRDMSVKLSAAFYSNPGNFEEDLENTVTHEMAHLVVGPANGGRPHGPQWRMVHRAMGGDGKCTHSLELAEGYKRKPRQMVPCPVCGENMNMGPTQMRRHIESIARGGQGYAHSKCP